MLITLLENQVSCTEEYQTLMVWENDLTLLWIGSNDIEEVYDPQEIINNI